MANICTGCGLDFRGVGYFDAHRIFDNPGRKEDWKTRRCLTPEELTALGMTLEDGAWGFPISEAKKAQFTALRAKASAK